MDQIGIYGAGGFAREVDWLISEIERSTDGRTTAVAYIDDVKTGEIAGKPILSAQEFAQRYPDALVTIAVGDPVAREEIALRCPVKRFVTLMAQSALYSDSVKFGEGCIVCDGCILTVNVTLGSHVHVNLDCTIGHDSVLEDFVTLAPGVHVSGNVHIGKGAYIGTGAAIINGTSDRPLVIGAHSVIGANACVTKDVEAGCLYAGVPAVLKKHY